jgi:hypothetical protein
MRLRTLIIILQLTVIKTFGQIEIKLYFKNQCNDSIYNLSYGVYDINNFVKGEYINSVDSKVTLLNSGTYHVFTSFVNGDIAHVFDPDIDIGDSSNQIDTLIIPRIKFTTGAELHTKRWGYYNCDKPCNGRETDFYKSGIKRLEGEFIDGKPNWLVEYRINGTKKNESWFAPGDYFPKRLNSYDDKGQLREYEIKEFKKHRTITSTYDPNGKLLDRSVRKF